MSDTVSSYGQDRQLPPPANCVPATIPVVVLEGLDTGDGRRIDLDALAHRALPLPLLSLSRTGQGGHDGATVIGRMDSLERVPGSSVVNVDTGEPFGDGVNVWRCTEAYIDPTHADYPLIRNGFLTGVSVDLADEEVEFAEQGDGDDLDLLMTVTKARIAAATVCTIPAFAAAHIVLADEAPDAEAPAEVPEPVHAAAFRIGDESALCASCSAPPAAWFDDPQLAELTPLTVGEDGRVWGHVAGWNICHTGLPGCTTAPRSRSGYAYFLTGAVLVDTGEHVPVGHLTLGTGHASLDASAAAAAEHYDHTGAAVADVTVGEDEHGIWCTGAVRPGVSDEQLRALRASPISGDWRPIGGGLELVGALCVNVPGFPIPRARARVAAGAPLALVAAGALPRQETVMAKPTPPPPPGKQAPAEPADQPPADDPQGDQVQTGDVVNVDAGGGTLMGVVNAVDDTGVTVEVVCDPSMLTPAEPVTSDGRRIDALERQLRALRAQQLLDRVTR